MTTVKVKFFFELLLFLLIIICMNGNVRHKRVVMPGEKRNNRYTQKFCMPYDSFIRAKHKSCFLRPDSGPCRADIVQWYFDVKARRCYKFFWGGCQGNGNRFETRDECLSHCFLDTQTPDQRRIPHFCDLAFDYGSCFGYFNRWSWDKISKTCKLRLYSGCGGNQNNFQTWSDCLATCMWAPNNTFQNYNAYTTCIPFQAKELF